MPKQLISADPSQIKSVQFAHFGVLNDGAQSKASTITSISLNVVIALVIIVVGAATKKTIDNREKLATLVDPVVLKPLEVEKPKIIPKPPPKLPTPPKIVVQPPKITIPVPEKLPDVPKPAVVKMDTPKPVIAPPAPQKVVAPPAPQVVKLPTAAPAAVATNNPHPSAVALGRPDNPIAVSNAPAVASVNLGNKGVAGMPAGNTGTGPAKVSLGNGQPNGTAMKGPMGPVAVAGIPKGVPGGTGPLTSTSRGPAQVQIGQIQQPSMPKPAAEVAKLPARTGPQVLSRPKPVYTAEAVSLHIEGTVSVRIRVSASGAVEVIGVTSGLGHGLDESAVRAAQGIKFKPAVDTAGNPINWEGVVSVLFQLAG